MSHSRGMFAALSNVLEDKDIFQGWRDELPAPLPRGWVGVTDVACSKKHQGVVVPRRRRDAYHVAEVLHEVAHLEKWRWEGRSPSQQKETGVCYLALEIGRTYGFPASVIEWLEHDYFIEREAAKQ